MNALQAWAARWGVSNAALLDLTATTLPVDGGPGRVVPGASEAAVQSQARVVASRMGWRVWRNNVGVYNDPETGAYVRFGLANDSAAVNRACKSADLIGVRPVVIRDEHVGHTIGQFVSIECKAAGWRWSGTEREVAQAAWARLVQSLGGHAVFCNDAGALR